MEEALLAAKGKIMINLDKADRYFDQVYELLQKTIFNFIDHVQDLEIAEDDFERIKRKTIGNFINSYNSPESIANTFSRYYFEGICSFDLVDYVSKMTLADINEVKRYFNKEYASSYIVKKDK